ncbi:hypothetical protein MTR_4g063865 [Medicago truncatula]|uniref:Uncharacterized protein n=1 Tax=Medicago truncatula TaxID=3880 RepID=A0A072UK70_MEDTR|nr:hypothetical protein MTR_4g063865 [Medicago truncatula]
MTSCLRRCSTSPPHPPRLLHHPLPKLHHSSHLKANTPIRLSLRKSETNSTLPFHHLHHHPLITTTLPSTTTTPNNIISVNL